MQLVKRTLWWYWFMVMISNYTILLMAEEGCMQGEYKIGTECCPMCQAATRVRRHCTEISGTTCVPCLEGTYMDHPSGLTECFKCKVCDQGMGLSEKQKCTYSKNTVCGCQSGFYCTELTGIDCELCQKQTICEPGFYVLKSGTETTDTVCERCPGGTFSTQNMSEECASWTSCTDQKMIKVKSGTSSSDTVCGENKKTRWIGFGISISLSLVAAISTAIACALKKRHPDFFTNKNHEGEKSEVVALNSDILDGQEQHKNPAQKSHVTLAKGFSERSSHRERDNREGYLEEKTSKNKQESLLQPDAEFICRISPVQETGGNVTINVHQTVNVTQPRREMDSHTGVHSSNHSAGDPDLSTPVEETGK